VAVSTEHGPATTLIFAADHLVFLLDGGHALHLREDRERFEGVMAALVADAGDDRTLDAADEARFVVELLYGVGHLLNILFACSRS
jgi:hypothetical protein